MKLIVTSGKRKRATAKAVLRPGTGKVTINKFPPQFLGHKISQLKLQEPLQLAGDVPSKVDIDLSVCGGGYNSQAEAARVAIARALVEFSPRLKEVFLEYNRQLLVADVRRKEASKPNSHGQARAKVQKSYR
jgi:small subunit ribosomal protein S9